MIVDLAPSQVVIVRVAGLAVLVGLTRTVSNSEMDKYRR
jgi:hypothetical protein